VLDLLAAGADRAEILGDYPLLEESDTPPRWNTRRSRAIIPFYALPDALPSSLRAMPFRRHNKEGVDGRADTRPGRRGGPASSCAHSVRVSTAFHDAIAKQGVDGRADTRPARRGGPASSCVHSVRVSTAFHDAIAKQGVKFGAKPDPGGHNLPGCGKIATRWSLLHTRAQIRLAKAQPSGS